MFIVMIVPVRGYKLHNNFLCEVNFVFSIFSSALFQVLLQNLYGNNHVLFKFEVFFHRIPILGYSLYVNSYVCTPWTVCFKPTKPALTI